MHRTLPLLLTVGLLAAGAAAGLGQHVTAFLDATAERDPAVVAPPGAPAPGAFAPWLRAWDPLGFAGDVAGDARGAVEAEKSADIAEANAAAAGAAASVQGMVAGDQGDAAAAVALVLDGDDATTGVNDLVAAQAPGLGAPSDAVPAASAPGFAFAPVPDPSFARPTGALAGLQPPAVGFAAWHPEASLAASRDALQGWADGSSGWALARAGEAQADAQAFATTAASFAGATAAAAGDLAEGAADLAPTPPGA